MMLVVASICWAVTGAKYCFKYFYKSYFILSLQWLEGRYFYYPFFVYKGGNERQRVACTRSHSN